MKHQNKTNPELLRNQFLQLLEERIVIMDGAMGSMIQTKNLTEEDFQGNLFPKHTKELRGCNDLLCLTQPDVIEDIHRNYLSTRFMARVSLRTMNAMKIQVISRTHCVHMYRAA